MLKKREMNNYAADDAVSKIIQSHRQYLVFFKAFATATKLKDAEELCFCFFSGAPTVLLEKLIQIKNT